MKDEQAMTGRWMQWGTLAVLVGLVAACGGGGGSKNTGAGTSTAIPAQSRASLAVSRLSIEGLERDGVETEFTFSLADRNGNPVADGVTVTFVTESGLLVPPTCVVQGGSSRCTTVLRSQGTRPANGVVSVLAYVTGDEDFSDLNGNSRWDSGEPFTDLGDAYRDDDDSSTWAAGEFFVPRGGAVPCAANTLPQPVPGRPGTCDGSWGKADVRQQAHVVFAGSDAVFTIAAVTLPVAGATVLTVADRNGNNMPFGTGLDLVIRPGGTEGGCQAELSSATVPNQRGPFTLSLVTRLCAAGDVIRLRATTPSGIVTLRDVAVS